MDGETGHRLLCFGAHPDDCELQASGLTALWTGAGGCARFVAMTDGSAGHQTLAGPELARLRQAEAHAGAAILGADSLVLDNRDGELLPSLDNRHKVIKAILANFAPTSLSATGSTTTTPTTATRARQCRTPATW